MTQQERDLIESLANRIGATQLQDKDPEAEALIRQKIGANPNALYILAQTVLIQEMALNQANQRLHDLQQQLDSHQGTESSHNTSFLGRLFGAGAPRPAAPPQTYAQPSYQQPSYQEPPPASYPPPQSQGSSFLRSAATTATGVAAGALAFEGIESLFGHHGGWGGPAYGSFGGGQFIPEAPQETVINNYYDDAPRDDGGRDSYDAGQRGNTSYDDASDFSDNSADTGSDSGSDSGSVDI